MNEHTTPQSPAPHNQPPAEFAAFFAPAVKYESKLRLAFVGPSGSGKTYSALRVAFGIVGPKGRVCVIDSERGSAAKYAGDFPPYMVGNLERHAPQDYVRAIRLAEQAADIIVIDSLSHAWAGRGGALEMVDQIAKRSRAANSFAAWRDVTPAHNELVDALMGSRCHIIATMRSKTEYVIEKDERTGKSVPRKVGLAPVQRDGVEYEFDVVGDIDHDHNYVVSKSRCSAVSDAVIHKPGEEFARILTVWLAGEARPAPVQAARPTPAPITGPAPVIAQPAPAQAAPAADHADELADMLRRFTEAEDEDALKALGATIKGFGWPKSIADRARKAYSDRQAELRAGAATAADRKLIAEAYADEKSAQELISFAGSQGIDLSEGVNALTPSDLAALAGWIRAGNAV